MRRRTRLKQEARETQKRLYSSSWFPWALGNARAFETFRPFRLDRVVSLSPRHAMSTYQDLGTFVVQMEGTS